MESLNNSNNESKIELPEHYDSIDYLPMLSWEKVQKKSDLRHLLKKYQNVTPEQKLELKKVWDNIYNEFISAFGFSDKFNDIIDQKLKIARLQRKHIITGDDSIINFIRENEKVLNAMESKQDEGDIYETKQIIEKHFGIRISLIDCTVRDFYSYIKTMKSK